MNHPLPHQDRRRFLLGSGGAALALPLLPSLFTPAQAQAQAAAQKCFVQFVTGHGGINQGSMYPRAIDAQQATPAGFAVRRSLLAPAISTVDGQTRLSDVLRAPSTALTPGLVAKMNVLNGLGLSFYIGHHRSAVLGNFADSDQSPGEIKAEGGRVTVDQIMAFSPSFYRADPKMRSVVMGRSPSYTYDGGRALDRIKRSEKAPSTNVALFTALFGSAAGGGQPPADAQQGKRLLVDGVLEDYRRLRDGGRLSAADKARLNDHMDRMAELQRRLQAAQAPVGEASPPSRSNQGLDRQLNEQAQRDYYQLFNDVVVAAMSAGLTRIFVQDQTDSNNFSLFSGDWHLDVVHAENEDRGLSSAQRAALQTQVVVRNQRFFEQVVLDFVRKLDAVPGALGGTLLDQSLVAWGQESGNYTHESTSMPVVAFGSAGGFLNTGLYCDYRNLGKTVNVGTPPRGESMWHGLLWHQWLGTALQAMGIPKSEYEGTYKGRVVGGYPNVRVEQEDFGGRRGRNEPNYPEIVWSEASNVLPFLKA